LADAEKQAGSLLKNLKRLRRAAAEGAVSSLPAALAAARAEAEKAADPLVKAAADFEYDVASAFNSGAWLDDLAAASGASSNAASGQASSPRN
jgi:hypothetical protein